MFIGLMITAVAAYAASSSEVFLAARDSNTAVFYLLVFGELALVFVLSIFMNKLSPAVCMAFFLVYALLNGLTLSSVFILYTSSSIASAFLSTGLTFGAMSAYGYITKKDLTTIGNMCFMGLIGIIIASIVNIFLKSDMFSFVIAGVGLFIFIGLTAFDTQKIKKRLETETDNTSAQRIVVWGALALYLDFINMFLKILSLIGKRR
jgi:FtsH-binding integral membrane protein